MCLVVLAWNVPDRERLVLVGNRDEFHARATAAMDWWAAPRLLAGRDLAAGGTWFGIDPRGRFGVVTNRRGVPSPVEPPSRGTLIPRFLAGDAPAGDFMAALADDAHRYAGFSLLIADERELWYLSNGERGGPRLLGAGLYGLSNGTLDADWPKIRQSRRRLAAHLAGPPRAAEELFAVLDDRAPAPDAELPDTGISLELERLLSPQFIVGDGYGTRATTAVVLGDDGRGQVVERTHAADGGVTGLRRFHL